MYFCSLSLDVSLAPGGGHEHIFRRDGGSPRDAALQRSSLRGLKWELLLSPGALPGCQASVRALTPRVPNPTDAMWSIEVGCAKTSEKFLREEIRVLKRLPQPLA